MNIEIIRKRNIELNQNKYGISLVYGFPVDKYLIDLFDKIVINLSENLLITDSNRLHITLLRSKSNVLADRIYPNVPEWTEKMIINEDKTILISEKIVLSEDGAIRLFFKYQNNSSFLSELNSSNLKELSNNFGVEINKPEIIWITFATLNYRKLNEKKWNQIKTFVDNLEVMVKIEINDVKLIFYEDIEFRNIQFLKLYKLKSH
ncbi:MAG: hypothetical protein HGB06_07950 [Chlorobaculum sp.]|jgi:hypothetical protein|nr:hypothetical protein [Chlorobaculum sp.]